MRALHVRLTLSFALLLAGLAIGLLVLLSRTSDRYSDEVLQRLNSGIVLYVVQELPLLEGGKVNEVALHELAHRTMTVNPSAEVYLLDSSGRLLSTAIPRNRIRRVTVSLEPIRTFLRFPDTRPLYGDDPTSLDARRVFSVAAIQSEGQIQGYLYVVLGGSQPNRSTPVYGKLLASDRRDGSCSGTRGNVTDLGSPLCRAHTPAETARPSNA
jgi:hypothetical protein